MPYAILLRFLMLMVWQTDVHFSITTLHNKQICFSDKNALRNASALSDAGGTAE